MSAAPLVFAVLAGVLTTLVAASGINLIFKILPSRYHAAENPKDDHIQILVLGDIGRSPRMQYHALSVMKHGGKVDLVGYKETARHPDLVGNDRVTLYPLPALPSVFKWNTLPLLINKPAKVVWQAWSIFYVLAYTAPPARWIIIQNPPSIPTLHLALLISLLRGSHLLIDWHNYGWSIMATGRSRKNPLVWMYKKYETFFGRIVPTANLTVTQAMARQLREKPYNNKKPIHVLHDRPAEVFQPIQSAGARKDFLSRLKETKDFADAILEGTTRLIVSSTSWTPDEDFGLLLDALVAYAHPEEAVTENGVGRPHILAIITGKGPQKAEYEEKIKTLRLEGKLPGITILTTWLSTREYATLLACADLGVCLHMSSSGVDLPMKVVDMFGSGLPVAAYSAYESFGELVKEGENGCGFETATELAEVLIRLLSESGREELKNLKAGAVKEGSLRWDEEWDRVVGRVVGVIDI
ncbi:glycosyl transferase group 1 [Colletotrichum truncatum]|uniref:Glycosyl transferase group 1 n=1 Tax=Colletotrichum truncatum TaxID=5467 RepID=A0ACC3YNF0_COLTU|nr:glycosyl transferase group 1 [Colletotrichum truncatum]KAF6789552.1 glycosyl transferase group 1 [Colletotrichum truncatum]